MCADINYEKKKGIAVIYNYSFSMKGDSLLAVNSVSMLRHILRVEENTVFAIVMPGNLENHKTITLIENHHTHRHKQMATNRGDINPH